MNSQEAAVKEGRRVFVGGLPVKLDEGKPLLTSSHSSRVLRPIRHHSRHKNWQKQEDRRIAGFRLCGLQRPSHYGLGGQAKACDPWSRGSSPIIQLDVQSFKTESDVQADRNTLLLRKVFVKSLPLSCDKGQLAASMEVFGHVDKSFVLYNHKDGCSRGFGFIEFSHIQSAEKAASQGKILISGKYAIVERAIAKNEIASSDQESSKVGRAKTKKLQRVEARPIPKTRVELKSAQFERKIPTEPKGFYPELEQYSDSETGFAIQGNLNSASAAKADELECVTCGSFKATPEYLQYDGPLVKGRSVRCTHLSIELADGIFPPFQFQASSHQKESKAQSASVLEDTKSMSASPELTCRPRAQQDEKSSDLFLGLTFKEYLKAGGPYQNLIHSSNKWPELRFNRQRLT